MNRRGRGGDGANKKDGEEVMIFTYPHKRISGRNVTTHVQLVLSCNSSLITSFRPNINT